MKLTLVTMTAAVVGQFTEAPHYIEHVHKTEDVTVAFKSGTTPGLSFAESKQDGKLTTNVTVTVPTNGGLTQPFSVLCDDNLQRDRIVKAVSDAYMAWLKRDTTTGAKAISLSPDEK